MGSAFGALDGTEPYEWKTWKTEREIGDDITKTYDDIVDVNDAMGR